MSCIPGFTQKMSDLFDFQTFYCRVCHWEDWLSFVLQILLEHLHLLKLRHSVLTAHTPQRERGAYTALYVLCYTHARFHARSQLLDREKG